MLKKKSAFETKKTEKQETGEGKLDDGDDAVDSEHVNELSDLFSTIENEFADGSAIDFSVLLEGEHAFNVEEVSEIFTDLEDAQPAAGPVVTTQDVEDAAVVDDMAALFASLEELPREEEEVEVDTDSDAESTEGSLVVDEVDVKDAENVDELSDLFSALEEKEEEGSVAVSQADWIASLDVDDVSELYSELETLQQQTSQPELKEERVVPAAPVDPRIFVPKFSIRMDGTAPAAVPLHRVPTRGAFLAGPPGLMLAGPPVRHSVRGVAPGQLHHEKRKAAADPIISETRRICAAKRRRVNGRFVREQSSFVSITSLQPTP